MQKLLDPVGAITKNGNFSKKNFSKDDSGHKNNLF